VLNFILVAAVQRQRDVRSVPPGGSAVRCRTRSAPAMNDRTKRSFVDVEPVPENAKRNVFRCA
jgi:hypothetical protein